MDGSEEPCYPEAAWRRLGQAVRRRRIELGFSSQAALAAEGGPSLSVVNKIEAARGRAYTDRVIIPLEDRLGWGRGSVQRVLDGGEPVCPGVSTAPAAGGGAAGFPAEVAEDPFLKFIWDAPESLAGSDDKWAAVSGVLLIRKRPVRPGPTTRTPPSAASV